MATDPTSSVTSGYHLFLEPSGELKERCAHSIQLLARVHDGPVFPPHITLAARIEAEHDDLVCERAAQLAQELVPFELTLGELSGESSFFRAFYISVMNTPELIQAHDRAHALFDLPQESFNPHMSLFYGLINDGVREEMKQSIEVPQGSFLIDRIHAYRTQGAADRWEHLAEYPFGA